MIGLSFALLTGLAEATCPDLQTFPPSGAVGVPVEIGQFWVKPLTRNDGILDPNHSCIPDSFELTRRDTPEVVIASDEGHDLRFRSRASMPVLETDTEYSVRIFRRGGEVWTTTFTTGAAANPEPPRLESFVLRAVSLGRKGDDNQCAFATIDLHTNDPWTVVSAGVGKQAAWTAVDVGASEVRLSTANDATWPKDGGGYGGTHCVIVEVSGSRGLVEELRQCTEVERTNDLSDCPFGSYLSTYENATMEPCSAGPAPRGLVLPGLFLAMAGVVRRRPRADRGQSRG